MGEADERMAKKVRDKLMEEVVMMSKMLESSRKIEDENEGSCQGR